MVLLRFCYVPEDCHAYIYAFVRLGGRLSITQLQLTGSAAQNMLLSMYSGTAMLWNHELDVV